MNSYLKLYLNRKQEISEISPALLVSLKSLPIEAKKSCVVVKPGNQR